MNLFYHITVIFALCLFAIPASGRHLQFQLSGFECFYEDLVENTECSLEYAPITGGWSSYRRVRRRSRRQLHLQTRKERLRSSQIYHGKERNIHNLFQQCFWILHRWEPCLLRFNQRVMKMQWGMKGLARRRQHWLTLRSRSSVYTRTSTWLKGTRIITDSEKRTVVSLRSTFLSECSGGRSDNLLSLLRLVCFRFMCYEDFLQFLKRNSKGNLDKMWIDIVG